jgi:ketosteroid isomerase-like protein
MSQAHVEIATRGTDAYNRRDVDAFADLTTPDYEWFPALAIVVGGGYRGREGIENVLRGHAQPLGGGPRIH